MAVIEKAVPPRDSAGKSEGGLMTRLLEGDVAGLPVVFGLVLIAIVFQVANSNFLSPLNLTNLMVQIAAIGTVSIGIVFILLLGEIDLSVGAVSGLSAAVTAVLATKSGQPGVVAISAGIGAGLIVGLVQGTWITKLHVPSFIVTLAGSIALQGALLFVLGPTGTINLTDPLIVGLANERLPFIAGWILAAIIVVGAAGNIFWGIRRRSRLGIQAPSIGTTALQILGIAICVFAAVGVMSINRSPNPAFPIQGVPSGVLIFLVLVLVFDVVVRQTKFGRYIFAVGGNAEAARRAGIPVDRIRIAVYVIASTLAAWGGIMAASRLFAVNQSSGGGDFLLNAIAAPVIAGTSLFGGRGSIWTALLGSLVIGAISNGMDLLALASSIKFMITGGVLLAAVTLDAVTRRKREASGR